jgi:NADH dehydrogenase FAD-containing subunit
MYSEDRSILFIDDVKFDEDRRLKVNEFLQVEGYTNVYAIGDCNNTNEDKMAVHAGFHADLVAGNLLKEAKGQVMSPYKQGKYTYFILNIS